jgi:hypothetical protein
MYKWLNIQVKYILGKSELWLNNTDPKLNNRTQINTQLSIFPDDQIKSKTYFSLSTEQSLSL